MNHWDFIGEVASIIVIIDGLIALYNWTIKYRNDDSGIKKKSFFNAIYSKIELKE